MPDTPLGRLLADHKYVVQITSVRNFCRYICTMHTRAKAFSHTIAGVAAGTLLFTLTGCATLVVGAAVGTVATVAVETTKVPFRVADTAIELATGEDEED